MKILVYLLGALLSLGTLSCTTTTTEKRVISTDAGGGGTTSTDGSDGSTGTTDATDGVDGTDGANTSTDGSATGADATDAIDGTDAETTSTDGPVNQCGEMGEGKGIGEPCLSHAECATGYCYDEAYLSEDGSQTYRFCTAKCAGCTTVGNCNEWPMGPGVKANTCYIFKSAFINEYNLKADSLCLPTCSSDSDCIGLGPFSKCGKVQYSWTEGEECFGGVQKVCQPPEPIGPECD